MSELKTVDNAAYKTTIVIGTGKLKQVGWYITNVFFFRNPLNISSALKVSLLKLFGASIGTGVIIKPAVNIKYPWKLSIGNHSWIGENVWIDNLANITIGANVCISQGALLLTGNHNYKHSSFDLILKSIVIEDGVWIGAKAIVCQGVICGTHAILSVASVASSQLQPWSIYRGNPARRVGDRLIDQ
jgi:putative colanic acid biosynthesis acetyltransferase WcaF